MSYCKQSRNKICLQLSDENIPNTWKCEKHKRTLIEKAFCPGSGKGFQWRRMFTFVGRLSLSLSLQRNSSTVKVSHWKPSTGAIPNGRLEGDASRLMDVKTCLSLKSSCFRTGNYQLEYLSHLTTRIPLFVRSFVRSFFGSPSRFFIPSDILHCLKNSLCEA